MSTIYSRCYALYKEQKVKTMATNDEMMEIGLKVIKKFRYQYKDKQPKRIQAPEYVGDFKVAYYPAVFTGEMDKSIQHFFNSQKEKAPRLRKKIISKV